MSWLFSRALVAAFLPMNCAATAPYAQLNVMPTPQPFWRNDKTMEPSRFSRFGLTYAPLTADHGEELLMSFQAAFRARTSVLPEQRQALKVAAPASGNRWVESSVKFDLGSSEWKTHRCLWDEALPWSSVILPHWGSMRDGVVYQPLPLAPPTSEIARGWSGETLPTPSVSMAKGSSEKALTRVNGRSRLRNRLDYWVERTGKNGRLNPEFVEWVMGWPIGWTDVAPLATDRFREWLQQHGTCSRVAPIEQQPKGGV
ncbi:hypothetical protein J2W24_002677 [Variovorax boronicumulans]|nr:hypothetical protein [Variovorax boronicumulans]MDP9917026.1 hypothetical protein [Variovorax boronicumulans]